MVVLVVVKIVLTTMISITISSKHITKLQALEIFCKLGLLIESSKLTAYTSITGYLLYMLAVICTHPDQLYQ